MSVHLKEIRKVAVIGWKTEGEGRAVIEGDTASLQVEDEEKRTVKNDGESNLFFPMDFYGRVRVVVEGSKGGHTSGTFEID